MVGFFAVSIVRFTDLYQGKVDSLLEPVHV
jgi:hypothetical protein